MFYLLLQIIGAFILLGLCLWLLQGLAFLLSPLGEWWEKQGNPEEQPFTTLSLKKNLRDGLLVIVGMIAGGLLIVVIAEQLRKLIP
jgi:hypothetical protein